MDFSVNLVQICCLFLLLLVRLKPCSGSGSVLLNASVGPGWIYHIDRDLTPGSVLRFIHIQRRTGVVFLSKVPRCGFRRRNSFPVYVQLRSLTDPQESIVIRLRLLLHSRDCVIRPAGQSVNSAVSVHLTLRSGTVPPCALTDHLRSKVHHHLPHFLRRNQHFQISCAAKGKKKSFSGGLSPECLTSELEAVCALWDARSHRTSTLVLLKLRPADPPADVTPVFAKRRRRAPVNSAPHFQLPNYQVSVPENEPARTRVITLKALDGDLGAAGQVSYHMEALFDSRSNDYFQIDPFTGGISTLQPLDREVKDTHVFRVVATDNGEPRKSSTAYLTVTVSDTNDHGPVFEQTEYRISIRENVEAGFEMLTIRASDGDAPSNGNMIYRIISEEDTAPFEIHPRTGVVRVTERPDRERVAQYRLVVEASDQGRNPGPLTSTATMFVSVEDENDNYPQFIQRRHVVQMLESVAANTRVTQVEATDEDEGDNGKVHYSIISGNVRGQFYIHSLTGVIFLISPLDHETVREYNLRVKAQDGGRPPLINTTGLVVVRVVDVNDNAPMFVSTPFQATVLENMVIGHSVIHIQAIDADSGNNSHLEYRLTDAAPDVPFTINKSTGWVTVTGELDRETTEFYMFGVEAVDHGVPAMSSSASVSLTVLDVNDNVPTYTQALYNIKINEDAAVGTSVLLLSAVDRDANSIVIYQISSGNTRNRFSITSQSAGGLITLALPLDYKQERQYVLTVTASDGTLQDAVQVYVNVTDANTHQPVFQSTNYQVMLSEDRPVGSTVVTISATDEDTGENARISYIMEDNVPQFKIHPGTGAITTQTDVDYEDQASYTLAIIAHDHGIPQKSDTTYVEIIVLDANDNAPQFHRDLYQGSVFEDAPVHTSVLQICASDRDSGANGRVSYAFHSSEDGDFFIEPYSGIIRTARKLDRENVEVYHLRAVAVDKGVPPLRATVDVQVSVLDINDNAPVFEEDEMNLYVTENSPVGSVIARITATDPDEGTNAQILFQIVEGNVPEVFQLDIFNGDLIALADLDYESKSKYTIIVQATSAPLVSRAAVHIHLLDVNDNVPVLQDFEIIFNNYITNRSDTFPSGVIGSVPARDPDVTDKLRFSFLEGNELNLLILNQASGELQLSRDLDNNRPLEASMKIRVSDGVHQVTALCLLRVSIVTDDMLTNSVTVRLDNMSLQHFLSPLLSLFVDAMAAVLSTRRDHVFVFSIQNDSQVEGNVLNLTLSAMQPSEDHDALGGGVLSSETLQEQIYLNRTLLTLLSNQNVLPFDDNVCLREPCENYMKCVSALSFHSTAAFTASNTLLFRSIQPAGGLRCRCPPGFTGETCNMEVDQCYSSPCLNGGTCHRTEGGFNCQCPQRLSGARCQVDSGSGRCVSGVCKNGGRCVDLQVGGFVCQCPDGDFQTVYCEETSRSFPRRSFITYSGLRQRFRFHLSFRFVTRDRDALLLYNGRFNHRHDFIALEIVSEQVQLSFSAGENRTSVETFVEGGVSDGEWHSVHLHYYNKPSIGRLGPSGEKVAVVAVDDCDVELAIRFGSRIRNYSCAAQSAQTGPKKSLDLTGPLLLGGVPDLPEDLPVRSRDFEGCIRDLNIDGRQVDMARFIANNGTNAGCLVKQDFCSRTFCLNGGVCVNRWSSYSCQCPLGFGGQNCEHVMPSPLKFNGKALVWWAEPEVTISVPWYLGLMFRTRHRAGTLLKADAGESSRIHLLLSSSHLSFQVFVGVKRVALLDFHQTRVDDGEWHHVLMELKSSKDGKDVEYMAEVSLDYGLFQRTVEIGNELPGLRLKSLFVGGLMKKNGSVVNGWRGCIQGIRMGQTSMKLANVDLRGGQKVGVEDGCDVADSCRDAVCPPHSHCKDLWKGHACICLPGFFGRDCVDACLLNPCQNNSTCVHQPSSAHGYSCHCGDRYHGDYCQYSGDFRSDLPCARGWWGGPVCGPCNCDVSKGFDRDCNKTSGECRCKENYFRPHGGDFCLPCDCFQLGSVSRTCDTQTGQCLCRTGVIGRQCNTCDNPYAEVTSRGCVVVYDVCPRVFESGLWWPRTKFNQPAAVRCPRGSTGTAVRHCDEQNGWLRPLLFNCTSLSFRHLHYQEEELQRNGSRLDGERSRRIAVMLREATNETATLHGGDLQTAFSLLSLLLQYESQQHGFNMAATQDRHFHQNIVQAGSVLLERSGELQHQVQRSEGGASRLLTNFELYAQTLAENMRKTYLKPFIILTPNIIFSVDFLDGSRMKPRLSDIQTELPVDLQAAVDFISHDDFKSAPVSMETPAERPGDVSQTMLPPSDLSIKRRRHTEAWSSPLVAVVIVYRTLGDLLPQSPRAASQPVIKTPVVTMVMSGEGVSWPRPITLHLRLLESEGRARPRCVIWSHSAGVNGSCGWSSAGCDLIGRNETHVTCRCVQASSVAVVMDVSRRELPLKRLTFTSLSSSLLLLLITFVLLLGLTDLQSNLHNIHLNQLTSVFLSQLVFLLSIDRTQNQSVCKLAAILLHYCCMCSFCWMLVEELHVYRMLTETRNINHRHMTFYYAIGWGIPAAITGLSVGLDPGGFGSSEFCWLSVQDSVLWTVAGPVSAVLTVTMVMFVLAVKQSVGKKQLIAETAALSSSLRSAILLVLLLSASWLSGLMAVNSDVISLHYLFSTLSCLQGVCFFFSYCVFNRELRRNLKELFIRKKSGRELRNNHAAALTRSLNRNQSFPGDEGLYRTAIGESMASLNRNHSGLNCPPSSGSIRKCFHDNNNSLILTRKQFRKGSCSSDSSSDASLHSSDGEDEHLRNNQRQEEKDSTTQQGQTLSNHVRPYWQVEPPTAADSERLSEGGGVVGEVNQLNNQSVAENEALPTTPDGSQQPMRKRGILKMRTPPSPTLANRKYLLSESPSPGCPAAYSPSNLSLRQVAGGNRVLVKVIPPSTLLQTRPPLSPRQQYSGVTKMTRTRLAIVGRTEDEHESDCSDETSV
ncbi:cadherin EGF LAG seven-pass G-type receptor 1-like isoform X1 [Micropterus salmoides]|uniref:cadherin EGF LAG seven-pass G-type receptor 1-like isoform X1 n=1 Tax=Micropterus salmoides TaxID=27706 RepID=UPI0018EA5065|nr:cadherin EGF LAG seven-pass G-type receptor 1-like isoform X1 [Micropterus salmoides]